MDNFQELTDEQKAAVAKVEMMMTDARAKQSAQGFAFGMAKAFSDSKKPTETKGIEEDFRAENAEPGNETPEDKKEAAVAKVEMMLAETRAKQSTLGFALEKIKAYTDYDKPKEMEGFGDYLRAGNVTLGDGTEAGQNDAYIDMMMENRRAEQRPPGLAGFAYEKVKEYTESESVDYTDMLFRRLVKYGAIFTAVFIVVLFALLEAENMPKNTLFISAAVALIFSGVFVIGDTLNSLEKKMYANKAAPPDLTARGLFHLAAFLLFAGSAFAALYILGFRMSVTHIMISLFFGLIAAYLNGKGQLW
jgi:hypothetical protein